MMGDLVEHRAQRVAGVERVRIAPALGERPGEVVDGGTLNLELEVVPWRSLAVVVVVELDVLRVAGCSASSLRPWHRSMPPTNATSSDGSRSCCTTTSFWW